MASASASTAGRSGAIWILKSQPGTLKRSRTAVMAPCDDVRGGHFLEAEGILVAFHAGESEEVVDQPAEPVVLLGDELQVFAGGLFLERPGIEQRIHEHAHGGERGLEFVGDVGDEVVPELGQGHLPAHQAQRERGQHDHRGEHQDADPDIGGDPLLGGRVK